MAEEKPKPSGLQSLTGKTPDKSFQERHFPVRSLEDMVREIRRIGGTGKLEIHFRDGQARGEAKWQGFLREET